MLEHKYGSEKDVFEPAVGSIIGSYLLEQLSERGPMGLVFLARSHANTFRLRILPLPASMPSEERIVYLGRLQQEAGRLASLQHPRILPMVDYGTYTSMGVQSMPVPYLVSPYAPMSSLTEQLARKGPLDPRIVGRCLDQLAAALEYAHEQGILHRNLSTDNIFLQHDGHLLLADFGALRMLELLPPIGTVPSPALLALASPAPEQIHGKPIGPFTDVYALGAVIYRLLTGHRVFRGKTQQELMQQHLQAPVPPISTWRSELAALDGIIAQALAKDPAQRFPQPGAFANAYAQLISPDNTQRKSFAATAEEPRTPVRIQATGTMASAPSRSRKAASSSPRVSRRKALTFIGGGTAAAAILTVAFFGRQYLAGHTAPAHTTTNTTRASAHTTTTAPHTGASTPASGGGNTAHPTPTANPANVIANTGDVPTNSAKQFPITGQNNPGLLIHLQNGQFVAYNSTCTHAGCAVNYNTQNSLLECPCHGAVFDPAKNATPVSGPAPTALTAIAITVNPNGTITRT